MPLYFALADPTRRRILEMLAAGPLPAGTIAGAFAMTPPAVSQHLRVLRAASLVSVRIEGQRRIYLLNTGVLLAVGDWIGQLTRPAPPHPSGGVDDLVAAQADGEC